jgi:hypothetical protein
MRHNVKATGWILLAVGIITGLCSCEWRRSRTYTYPTLESAVREMSDFSRFDGTKLDDHTTVVVSSGGGRRFFNKEDIEAFHADAKRNGDSYTSTALNILSKEEPSNCHFASISYEVSWNISVGNKLQAVRVHSQEIWERQIDGWHRLFAAIDEE